MERKNLIAYRGKRTQKEMGQMYGVTQQAWNRWERGRTSPAPAIMKKLEDDSGTPMEVLFYDRFHNNMM